MKRRRGRKSRMERRGRKNRMKSKKERYWRRERGPGQALYKPGARGWLDLWSVRCEEIHTHLLVSSSLRETVRRPSIVIPWLCGQLASKFWPVVSIWSPSVLITSLCPSVLRRLSFLSLLTNTVRECDKIYKYLYIYSQRRGEDRTHTHARTPPGPVLLLCK